ncbi:MAG TPA: polyhydroxyalkanoic acid system family protein [Caulobacteraceae bacterium]
MTRPLAVTVRHDLGAAEARRRVDKGFRRLAQQIGVGLGTIEKDWKDNELAFSTATLGEAVSGRVSIEDERIRIVVDLPDFLGLMARRIGSRLRREAERLLEKK